MEDILIADNARLRRENERLKEENKRLKAEHAFAFRSWQQAIKRSGRLSADLEEARETNEAKTRVAPYKTIVSRKPPPLPPEAYRNRKPYE